MRKKVFICVLIFLIFIFFSINSYAVEVLEDVSFPFDISSKYVVYVKAKGVSTSLVVLSDYEFFLDTSVGNDFLSFTDGLSHKLYFYSRFKNDKDVMSVSLNDYSSTTSKTSRFSHFSNPEIVYSNFDLKKFDGSVFIPAPFKKPSFITKKEDLISGNIDYLKINAGDLKNEDDKFYLNIYEHVYLKDGYEDAYLKKAIELKNSNMNDYRYIVDFNPYYAIPKSELLTLEPGKRYIYQLADKIAETSYMNQKLLGSEFTEYAEIGFVVGERTSEDIIKDKQDETNDKLDEQTGAIKEQTETNKGIWETIKDIVSYINPLSENFFVYKLIALLVEAIKSLFIPSDDFFSRYFNDLKEWFSDRLGFLFYPFELIFDILDKIVHISFSEPVLNIPDMSEPFTGKKIISATTFNFNDMLTNNILKTAHNIYLVCVDAFIVIKLVNLAKRKWEEVTMQ